MNYSIKQFKKDFATEESCLDYIFKLRYPKAQGYYRSKTRKCYAHKNTGKQIHPLANTIFHKSDTPLTLWFFAIYLMATSKNGVSAKELQRHLGCTYKTAWRIGDKIRSLMTQGDDLFSGIVEADEMFVGGVHKGKQGRSKDKTPVIGLVKRGGGAKATKVEAVHTGTVLSNVAKGVQFGSRLITDDYPVYKKTKRMGLFHESVNHSKGEYVRGDVHTNTIEGFWSQIKRSIDGTYHVVSPKHLQSYLNEFSWKYTNRYSARPLFLMMLDAVVGRSGGEAQKSVPLMVPVA